MQCVTNLFGALLLVTEKKRMLEDHVQHNFSVRSASVNWVCWTVSMRAAVQQHKHQFLNSYF